MKKTIYVCDRCGKEFGEVSYGGEYLMADIKVNLVNCEISTMNRTSTFFYNLCGACTKEFEEFIKKEKNA